MAASYCGACGRAVPPGGVFCPWCGSTNVRPVGTTPVLGTAGPSTPPSGSLPGASALQRGFLTGTVAAQPADLGPQLRKWELTALVQLRIAMCIAIVETVVGVVTLGYSSATSLLSVETNSSSQILLSINVPFLALDMAVAVAVTLSEFFLLRSSLRTMLYVDSTFARPSTLALVALVGLIVVFLALGIFFDVLSQAINCAGGSGNPIPRSCLSVGGLVLGVVLEGVGALVFLVGYIGIVIGIWRVGKRCESVLVRIGAILLLIPVIQALGAVLVLVGTRGRIQRLRESLPAAGPSRS